MKELTAAQTKSITNAKDQVKAAANVMIETPLELIKCILLKHETAVIEVMKELHDEKMRLQQQRDELQHQLAGMTDSAKHFSNGMEYYCGLIDEAAKSIGIAMYTADDQGVHPDPLRSKLPECVAELVQQRDELLTALKLWKLASDNAEESELDDMACYCVPMPLFCDADEATEAALAKLGADKGEK